MFKVATHVVSFSVGFIIGAKMHDTVDISAGKIEIFQGEIDKVKIKIKDKGDR